MITEDQVIEYFSMTMIGAVIPDGTPMIFIYEHPEDYPELYVARLFNGRCGTHVIAIADTLEELRASKPERMAVIEKQEEDPPQIVETGL